MTCRETYLHLVRTRKLRKPTRRIAVSRTSVKWLSQDSSVGDNRSLQARKRLDDVAEVMVYVCRRDFACLT
jgi:hypothetical protein